MMPNYSPLQTPASMQNSEKGLQMETVTFVSTWTRSYNLETVDASSTPSTTTCANLHGKIVSNALDAGIWRARPSSHLSTANGGMATVLKLSRRTYLQSS